MLDELLGRASLKDRIDELEAETERLRRRLEAESDRRAEAVTARQDAEERQNRLEDRIAQLEGELERLEAAGGDSDLEFRRRARLRADRLSEVLGRLESFRTGPEGALTAGVDGSVPDEVAAALGDRAALIGRAAPCLVCADDAGLVSLAVDPPIVPAVDPAWSDRFELEREWFLPTGRHVVALIRADLFALGVYEGDERVDYRGFESDVKGSHSKGGYSQARFERIRDGQIAAHFEACREALAEYADERRFLVGQREGIDAVTEDVDPDATAVVDATGDPESALEDAVRSFWTTELLVI